MAAVADGNKRAMKTLAPAEIKTIDDALTKPLDNRYCLAFEHERGLFELFSQNSDGKCLAKP